MNIGQKVAILNELKTKKLIDDIQEQENTLENLLRADALYRSERIQCLAPHGEDSREVKGILADLVLEAPAPEGKKMTVAQTDAWLRTQRTANPSLAKAIQSQNEAAFMAENNRISTEMAKARLSSLRGLLGLRTAQIEFLGQD